MCSPSTVLAEWRRAPRGGGIPVSVISVSALDSGAMLLSPVFHLVWSASTIKLFGGGDEGPVGLGLHEVGRAEAGSFGDAVHAHEHRVEVERAQRPDGDRADQRVGRGADAAGEHHRAIGTLRLVQHLGDPDRVGHDREVGDVDEWSPTATSWCRR